MDAQLRSCSPLDANNNHYTLPDLRYGDDENVASNWSILCPADADSVDIYPVPSTLNCSGTVSAVEHCYTGLRGNFAYGINYPVFTLLTLEQNGLTFRITDRIIVRSTPISQRCTNSYAQFPNIVQYCCDSFPLHVIDQFRLPSSSFAFAIVPVSSTIRQLRYRYRIHPQYHVVMYSLPASVFRTLAVGNTFTLTTGVGTIAGMRLLRFVLSKYSTLSLIQTRI